MTQSSTRSSSVDLGATAAATMMKRATELALQHVGTVSGLPVSPAESGRDRIDAWLSRFDHYGSNDAVEVLSETIERLRLWGVHTTHPGCFGLFNPGPTLRQELGPS